MAKLTLTDTERLILANQYEILGLLKEGGDSEWYTRLAENLRDGHKWIYQQKLQLSENLSDADTNHVLDILGIFSALRDSYKQLADKSGITESDVTFPGFDGNNESELLHFARALSANGNYHETIGQEARNSHSPTRDTYSRMIGEWKRLGSPHFPFTKDQIVQILGARRFPRA